MICTCGGEMRVVDSRAATVQMHRRRYACSCCPKRETTYEVQREVLEPTGMLPKVGRARGPSRRGPRGPRSPR